MNYQEREAHAHDTMVNAAVAWDNLETQKEQLRKLRERLVKKELNVRQARHTYDKARLAIRENIVGYFNN